MAKGVRTYTEAKAVQAWIMRKKKQRTVIIAEAFNITEKSICNWIHKVNNNKDLLARAEAIYRDQIAETETTAPVGEISKICLQHVNVHEQLTDENAFLRWWNFGERKGWVDRLLKELESK